MERGLEKVELNFGQVLFESGSKPGHVYFPNDCLISLLLVIDGGALEVGLVGKEGMAGVAVALGHAESPVRALVQGTGSAMRMTTARFAQELKHNGDLQREVDRCVYAALTTAMQVAACNNAHLLEERLARWLLMVRDRVARDDFFLTQEFLARMLGVRRAGVTEAASALQRRDLIRYSRGRIRIIEPRKLRAAAFSCYKVIRKLENGET